MRLDDFAGLWTLERSVEDAREGVTWRLSGTARFTPAAAGLAYHEEGTLRRDDAPPLAASRDDLWREDGPGTIAVLFSDGRLFHRFAAGEIYPEAAHDCPPDLYRLRYDFSRWPCWQTEWRVQGPRKDYVATSTFARLDRAGRIRHDLTRHDRLRRPPCTRPHPS